MLQKNIKTPVGVVTIAVENGAVVRIDILPDGASKNKNIVQTANRSSVRARRAVPLPFDTKILNDAETQIHQYLAGERKKFDLPLNLQGTPFQKSVWKQLMKIPFGKALSYAELATRLGDKKLARAVGNANGKNPVPLVVPCHRVIATGGGLGGFSCGLDVKKKLLRLEGIAAK